MTDHISIGVRDLAKGEQFYAAALGTLGFAKLKDWEGTAIGFGKKYPEFWINKREGMGRVAAVRTVNEATYTIDMIVADCVAYRLRMSSTSVPLRIVSLRKGILDSCAGVPLS